MIYNTVLELYISEGRFQWGLTKLSLLCYFGYQFDLKALMVQQRDARSVEKGQAR